jgi:Uma2 family endonuclease
VAPTRFRIPGLCVVEGEEPDEQVFTSPPLICVGILSAEDRLSRMQDRVNDYLAFGVPKIRIIEPTERRAWIADRAGIREAAGGVLETADGRIRMPPDEVYGGR